MDVEKIISEIEWLERIFALPDKRPIAGPDRSEVNRRHDQQIATNPWFRLWQNNGLPR